MAEDNVLQVKLEMLHGDVVEVKTALNKLSDAITKLALVEQQQSQTAQALERAFKAISKIEDRLTSLEQAQPKTKETSDWVDRFILAIVACAAGFIGTKLGVM
jgi:chromosome segregation ATPase